MEAPGATSSAKAAVVSDAHAVQRASPSAQPCPSPAIAALAEGSEAADQAAKALDAALFSDAVREINAHGRATGGARYRCAACGPSSLPTHTAGDTPATTNAAADTPAPATAAPAAAETASGGEDTSSAAADAAALVRTAAPAAAEQDKECSCAKCFAESMLQCSTHAALMYELVGDEPERALHFACPCCPNGVEGVDKRAVLLTVNGYHHDALPHLQNAIFSRLYNCGPNCNCFLDVAYYLVKNLDARSSLGPDLLEWLLPRAAKHWGMNEHTQELVRLSARVACEMPDPAPYTGFVLVGELAHLLPGELGWGTTTIGPVPDEEAYRRHCLMQYKADCMLTQRDTRKLAKEMYKRCVTYFESLGSHWLATARKLICMQGYGVCVMHLEGPAAGEPLLREAKLTAKRELGPNHDITLDVTWAWIETIHGMGRKEQALSLFTKALRQRKETVGPNHHRTIENQYAVGRVLRGMRKFSEAESTFEQAFENALKVGGPEGANVQLILNCYWYLLHVFMKKRKAAKELRKRAEKLGCDVSECCMGDWHI